MEKSLLIEMIERMCVAATLAFIFFQTKQFRRLVFHRDMFRDRLILAALFGAIGIFGTYAGVPVQGALANSRVVGVMTAGLVGGPVMGAIAGLIAGGHRYFIGGFTAFSCAIASLAEGLFAGLIYRIYPEKPIPWWVALLAGIVGEAMQMAIILATAEPYDQAYILVSEIALPMIVVNSLGIAVFMLIVKAAMEAQKKLAAEQSHKALEIATKTLPYLRRGLDRETATAAACIIYDVAPYDSVAVTATDQALAFVGAEAQHHGPDITGLTAATKQVLATGELLVAQHSKEIGCTCRDCRLASAVVVPLKRAGQVIGTLKLYYTRPNAVGQADVIFAKGLAHLFSTQLELTEIDRQARLKSRAEVKALQSQINPHFFFNTLNTITSLVRTKPDLARELLIRLAAIFRFTLHKTGHTIPIAEELARVRDYLAIEKARHGEKLSVTEEIVTGLEQFYIPSLSVQPLIENAIRHGLQPKEAGGRIWLRVTEQGENIEIIVEDDGVGMDLLKRHPLTQPVGESIGLLNVAERLRGLYGDGYGLSLESTPGKGTRVSLLLPKRLQEVEDSD